MTIHRKDHPGHRRDTQFRREQSGSENLDFLRDEGRIVGGDNLMVALDAMATEWHRDYATGADVAMVVGRDIDANYLNDNARALRRMAGELGVDEIVVGERTFAEGDRVQARNSREGVADGERFDVLDVDPETDTILLRPLGDTIDMIWLDSAYLDRRSERDGGPALEHAYALTRRRPGADAVERSYLLLDSDSSLNDEMASLAERRAISAAYTIASPEASGFGPNHRQLSNELCDIRFSLMSEGRDFSALEADLRAKVRTCSMVELASRRFAVDAVAYTTDPNFSRFNHLETALDPELSLETNLIDTEINRRVAVQLASGRHQPSSPVYETFGPCPQGVPSESLAWHDGARALCTYSIRHGAWGSKDQPLGDPPKASGRAERARARRRIERAQRRLGREVQRGAGKDFSIGR